MRAELLAEHDAIRQRVCDVRNLLREVQAGRLSGLALRDPLMRLVDLLRGHNAHEEALLSELLACQDAWGEARSSLLGESHEAEQTRLTAALAESGVAFTEVHDVHSIEAALEGVLAHMEQEETVILDEHVLRDDDIVIEYFGG